MIAFACGSCGQALNVRDETAHKPYKCPRCGQVQQVPPPATLSVNASTRVPAPPPITAPSAPDLAEQPTVLPGPASNATPTETETLPPPGPATEYPDSATSSVVVSAASSTQLPGHEILGELGRGGMGIVYKARHTQLKRLVALKMILGGGHAGDESLARFRIEAEAVARIQHPGIVQIHEIGEHKGLPFFSLEFCPGGSLAHKLKGDPLPARAAAQLVEKLARAMAAAHAQGIVHRDLKPANVLLDADGEPKITDFGLAKKLDDDRGQTSTGAIMGTPSYMAPEQAGGESKRIGPASDLYALGAILYELLTGRPPFKGATVMDTLMQAVSDEPVPPSRLQRSIPLDLETICLKCLEKDPKRRYASAEELAEDLRRYQAGEPIRSRPIGVLRRGVKWARRRPTAAALMLVSVAAALTMLIGGLLFTYRLNEKTRLAQEERDRVIAQEKLTQQERDNARRQKEKAETNLGIAQAAEKRADEQLQRSEWLVYAGKLSLAQSAFEKGDGVLALQYLDECQWNLRGWEHRHLWTRFNSKQTLKGHTGYVSSVCFSPDGKRILTGSGDNTARVWDAERGQEILTLKGHTHGVSSVCFSSDGKRMLTGSGDRTAKVWDAERGQEILTLKGDTNGVSSVCFSPDGKRILTGIWDNTARVWDAERGQEILTLKGHTSSVTSVCFSPDGKRILTGSGDNTARVWDAERGQEILTLKGHTSVVISVCFSSDGKRILTGSGDNTARMWDAERGQEILTLKGHTSSVTSVCFSPDGKRILTGSGDNTARVWDAERGQEILTLKGHTGYVRRVCFSPDGKRILTGSEDKTARVWDAERGQEILTLKGHTAKIIRVSFTPDGSQVYAWDDQNRVLAWSLADGRTVPPDNPPQQSPPGPAHSSDGFRTALPQGTTLVITDTRLPRNDNTWPLPDAAECKRYHGEQAARAEQQGQHFAAAFHLGWLLRLQPDDAALHVRQAHHLALLGKQNQAVAQLLHALFLDPHVSLVPLDRGALVRTEQAAQTGDWRRAARDFELAAQQPDAPIGPYLNALQANYLANDVHSCQRIAADLIRWAGKDVARRETVLYNLEGMPCSTQTARVLLEWTADNLKRQRNAVTLHRHGAALYRVGKYTEAARLFAESVKALGKGGYVDTLAFHFGADENDLVVRIFLDKGRYVDTLAFQAMTAHHLGQLDQAQALLNRFEQWHARQKFPDWENRLKWRALLEEVRRVVNVPLEMPYASESPSRGWKSPK